MSKAGVKFADIREQLLKDVEFRAEYARLKPRYACISHIIAARAEHNAGGATSFSEARQRIAGDSQQHEREK